MPHELTRILRSRPDSDPIVPNGLALCRLHHGAFAKYLIGIRPDYTVEVRQSILDEHDGPMLRHGLQGVHNQRIWTPRSPALKPDRDRLEQGYEMCRKVGEGCDSILEVALVTRRTRRVRCAST
jgi:putative restriction endonuclease